MLSRSFRSVSRRFLPLCTAHKQASALVAVLLLAGCGGAKSAVAPATVTGSVGGAGGFRFEAPHGWKVTHADRAVSAASGADLVSVTVFPLQRAYLPALWPKVVTELDRRIADLAGQLRGELRSAGTTTVAGRRARIYEISVGDRVQRLLFLFRGRLEYQLLCRYAKGGDTTPCERLSASFTLA
jgi:hypothetical protein